MQSKPSNQVHEQVARASLRQSAFTTNRALRIAEGLAAALLWVGTFPVAATTVTIEPAIITLNAQLAPVTGSAASSSLVFAERMSQAQASATSDQWFDGHQTIVFPPCNYVGSLNWFPATPLTGSANPVSGSPFIAASGLNANVIIPASYYQASFTYSPACALAVVIPGPRDYLVDARVWLNSNRKTYYFEQLPTGTGIDPFVDRWSAPNNRQMSEEPGVMHVKLLCPTSGVTRNDLSSARVTATIGGTIQAEILHLPSGVTQLDDVLFVRGGGPYNVAIEYTANFNNYLDKFTWGVSLSGVTAAANAASPTDVFLDSLPCIDNLTYCTDGITPDYFGHIIGNADLVGVAENPGTRLVAGGGLYGNFRYGPPPPHSPSYASGPFLIQNIMALDSSGGPGGEDYNVYAQMSFPITAPSSGVQSESFTSPCNSVHVTPCQTNDIGNILVMTPGFVEGNIYLKGLLDTVNCPCVGQLDLPRSSVAATGPCNAGANVTFGGSFSSGDFTGDYKMALAELNPPSGLPHWQPNILDLYFNNPTAGVSDNHVTITDKLFVNQTVTAGVTLPNNHRYCFSYVTFEFVNANPARPFTNLKITGPGNFASAADFEGNPADYRVEVDASGVATASPGVNEGSVVVCLPEGTYTVTPSVSYPEGVATVPQISFTVGCGQKTNIVVFPRPEVDTNCCHDCPTNEYVSYTVHINANTDYYLVNPLCKGTNNTLATVLPDVPPSTEVRKFNCGFTSYVFDEFDLLWTPDGNATLNPGEGFILRSPTAFDLTFTGCEPDCPPRCLSPTNCCELVGRAGMGVATWDDLSSCPPECGTQVRIWNGTGFNIFDYVNGAWSPFPPVLAVGQSAFVCWVANSNCVPCTNNFLVNGSFESPSIGSNTYDSSLTGVPGWAGTGSQTNAASLEFWSGTFGGMVAQDGQQHLEINGNIANQSVSQVVTNLSTNCLTRFCFWYIGRPGFTDNSFVAEIIGSGLPPMPFNPPAYTTNTGWLEYCVEFFPVSTSLTIKFTATSGGGVTGGAHIDNVLLAQCCSNNPCTDPLVVNCPTNKMVDCDSEWNFDEPTASSPCCGTNLTIAAVSTWTNGLCPLIASRIWQITDCLNNTATCTQTVSVVDSTPPVFTVCLTNRVTVGGVADDFAGPEPTSPSSGLVTRLNNAGVVNFKGFDDCTQDRYLAHTFANLPGCITEAYLTVRLRACGGSVNDSIGLSFTDAGGNLMTNAGTWGRYLGSGNPSTGLTNVPWNSGATLLVQLDLSNLPNADGSFTDLLPFLNANGFLDFTVQDDTAVDYLVLDIVSCCCNSNVTVHCGDEWGFAAPIVTDNCCTNPTVSVVNAFTNGPCPQVVTWVWVATDCCGNSNTCVRQVTILDSTPPVITCAANKTVECGNLWTFDPPTGSDDCSPGVTFSLIASNFISATPCQKVFQGIWQAADACNNVSTCTQTVTTVDTTPPALSVCVSNRITIGGISDNFTGVEPTFPSAGMVTRLNNAGVFNFKQFDDCSVDTYFAHTITNLPGCITSARLRVRLRACGAGANDGIGISFTDINGVAQTNGWSSYIGSGNPGNPVTNTAWTAGTTVELNLDLSALPTGTGPVDLLPQLNANGYLDFAVQDDTAVDYLILDIVSCCCDSNLTVQCGDAWGFATPTVSDACCPVTYSGILNATTNGVCPQVITMTWWAADCCGNTNTCTRQVTVQDTTPPVVTCPLDKGVLCGSLWSFDPPTGLDACDGTNVTVSVVQTTTNGTCLKNFTRTWLISDTCGNSRTCVQTVTVADTTAPELHCPKNITRVICGNSAKVYYKAWAKDACSPPVTLTYNPPSGSTFFAGTTTTVTVTAADACGNTNTCTFTVKVVDKSIWTWYPWGQADCFKYPYDPVLRSTCLNTAYPFGPWKAFDDKNANRRFGHSWVGLPANISDAWLYTKMLPNCFFHSPLDDTLHLGLSACNSSGWLYTRYIGAGNGPAGLLPSVWCGPGGCGVPFTFHLANLPLGGGSLLPLMNGANHRLDMLVQDDTAVDYAWLRVRYCPPSQIVGGLGASLNNAIIADSWNSWCLAKDPLVVATNYGVTFNLGTATGAKLRLDLTQLRDASNAVVRTSLRREPADDNGSKAVGLTVSNIGSSGQDGVSIQFTASDPTNGSRLVLSFQGVIQFDQSYGPGVLPTSMTCSNLGSSGQDGVALTVGNIGSSGQDGVRISNLGSSGQDGVEFSGSFGTVLADEVRFTVLYDPQMLGPQPAWPSSVEVAAENVSEVGLLEVALELSGTTHAAADDTLAQVSGERFVVSSIVDPTDGQHDDLAVSDLSITPTNEFRVSLGTPFGEITPTATNASLSLITKGKEDESEDEKGKDTSKLRFDNSPAGWVLTVSSNDAPVPPKLVQVWDGTTLLASVSNVTSVILAALPPVHWPSVTWFVDADICHRLPYAATTTMQINGIGYQGTELRILTATDDLITTLTGVRVEARYSDMLSVSALATGAETYRLQVANLGSSGQDGVTIQWDGLGGVLRDATNVFGPWTSVSNGVGGEVTVPNGGQPVRVFRVQSP